MNFLKIIRAHAEKVASVKSSVKTEEATKTALILPFFQSVLGYDIFNPNEFVPEDSAVIDKAKWGSIDYCIHIDGRPAIIVEAKKVGSGLDGEIHQLFKYFVSSEAAFAILTNGVEYRFYTDLEKDNIMDTTPFLSVNILSLTREESDVLKLFHRDGFDFDEIYSAATSARDFRNVKNSLEKELASPSDDFVRLLIAPFYANMKNKYALDRFRPYVQAAIADFKAVSGGVADVLHGGEVDITHDNHGYSTAFVEIVRGVLTEAGISDKSFYGRVKKDYFYASYRKCQICLFHYDEHNLAQVHIQFMQPFMESGCDWERREQRERFIIASASDVREYADKIVAAARDIDEMWREYSRRKKED